MPSPTSFHLRLTTRAAAALLLLAARLAVAQAPSSVVAALPPGVGSIVASTTTSAALTIGEHLTYDIKFGSLRVGSGAMHVRELTEVRGRAAWHTVFTIKGRIPFFRVDDRLESWIDTRTFASLRFVQSQHEGRYHRERQIEFFPERRSYLEAGKDAEQPSVDLPLDDASFLYFVRTIPLEVGRSYELDRYFLPDRNPVRLDVVRRERITVPAGTFETIVVRPVIKTPGIFSESGRAEVWITDDERHLIVQMKTKLSFGTLSMFLKTYVSGTTP
jgi:hypothetical protein